MQAHGFPDKNIPATDGCKMNESCFVCRNCGGGDGRTFIDLGMSPLANAYVSRENADIADTFYPLHARVCVRCFLLQVDDVVPPHEIFNNEYAYFSSYSDSWLAHCKHYAYSAVSRYNLDSNNLVMEVASNDGYLLQYFKSAGVQVLGVEPSANTAAVAMEIGVNTRVEFFSEKLAHKLIAEGFRPALICAANVLAHVPDINDFVKGIALMLQDDAVFTVEFPELLQLIENVQFDTIYHEHYSYLSLFSTEHILNAVGLRVFDVEVLSTHGGSLRVHACLKTANHVELPSVARQRQSEMNACLDRVQGYQGFGEKVELVRTGLLQFLQCAARKNRRIAAYGAAAKGNTMLNYCGIRAGLIEYVVDKSPAKQNKLLPGSRIPILPIEELYDNPVDEIIILPWNIKEEIVESHADLKSRGSHFFVAVPEMVQVG